eukprot:841155_1
MSAVDAQECRTYKVICYYTRNHFDHMNQIKIEYIPESIKLLLLQFVGIHWWSTPIDRKCKIIFVGDVNVGKTSIITRYVYKTLAENNYTIGVDFALKRVRIQPYHKLSMQLWDSA